MSNKEEARALAADGLRRQADAIHRAEAGVRGAAEAKQFREESLKGVPVKRPVGVSLGALSPPVPPAPPAPHASKVQESGSPEPQAPAAPPTERATRHVDLPVVGASPAPDPLRAGMMAVLADGLQSVLAHLIEQQDPLAGEMQVYVRLLEGLRDDS